MNRFLNLLQFLTRITISKNLKYDEDMGKSMVYFPLVGMVIGAILSAEYYLLSILDGNNTIKMLIALIIVISEVLLTGGLHIDGLGDTFDGIYSYSSKERKLEIMKDPRMGSNGILAIIFLIIAKFICIYMAIDLSEIWMIYMMPVVGRLAPVIMSYRAVSARKGGMGELFIGRVSIYQLMGAVFITILNLVIANFIGSGICYQVIINIIGVAIVIVFTVFFRRSVYQQIGGITGDILGCVTELGEAIFIIFSVIVLSIKIT